MNRRILGAVGTLLGAALLGAPAFVVGTAAPAAAADGVVAVEPATGRTDWGVLRLVTNQACSSAATNMLVEVTGANFPQGSFAVGNSEIAGFSAAANGKGLVIPLLGSWDTLVEANGGKRGDLNGTATLTLICIDQAAEKALSRITGEVKFVKGSGPSGTYEQSDGPRLLSGIPYSAEDARLDEAYVYRYDLPVGSLGGPVAGGPTAPPALEADVASPGSTSATDARSEAGGSDEASTSTSTDQSLTSADSGSGPAPTALTIGLLVLGAAAACGYGTYARARNQAPH